VVQVALLAEDSALQAELAAHGVQTQTVSDIEPVAVYLSDQIVAAHGQVGHNERLGLTGRAARQLKTLATSRLYKLQGRTVVCLASFFSQQEFFLAYDLEFLVRRFRSELTYLHHNWTQPGRPTVAVLLTRDLLEPNRASFYTLMQQIESGRVDDVPVRRGSLVELMPTAAFERIDELRGLQFPIAPTSRLVAHGGALADSGHHAPLEPSTELEIDIATDAAPLVARLEQTGNLYEQIELIARLRSLGALDTHIPVRGVLSTLESLAEDVYERAGRRRLWAVVRHSAGILGKMDGDLNLAAGAILARQKNIQVGRAYTDSSVISRPIPDRQLMETIATFCRDDIRDRVLTQEIVLYLGLLIKERPELFSELLTLRIGQLILLLSSHLVQEAETTPDEAYESLMHMAPSEVQARLEAVLSQYDALSTLPQQIEHLRTDKEPGPLGWRENLGLGKLDEPAEGWLAWRQHQGIIDRRPARFYESVWNLFRHTPCVVVGDKLERRNRMESSTVLSDMTAGEQAFALSLEHLLNKIQAPEYRQLNIEALRVMASFFRQNPTLQLQDTLALDVLIGHAVRFCYVADNPDSESQYDAHKAAAWDAFYAAAPAKTSACLVGALRTLLMVRAA
jgi:phosphorylase kinase alpha/beta subunit